jgi:hypothetical protein
MNSLIQELEQIAIDVLRNYNANPELARRIWNDIIEVRMLSIEDNDCYFKRLTIEKMHELLQKHSEFIEYTRNIPSYSK